jgi:endo-1,4-beta-xylanase
LQNRRLDFLKPSRRGLGAWVLAGTAALSRSNALADAVCRDDGAVKAHRLTDPTPLGDLNPAIPWGTHLEGAAIYDAAFLDALAREKPEVIAIGSALKFGALHPLSIACVREAQGKTYSTWTEVDDIVTVAARLGALVRGDALVWNDWLPEWIGSLARDRPKGWRDLLQAAFDQHLRDVFSRFDRPVRPHPEAAMRWCGVVNEPFESWALNAGKFPWRKGAWLDAFDADSNGAPGYIGKAFELAEKYGRAGKSLLFLNEANCENDRFGPKLRPALLALVAQLKQAGRKVDAVGLEAHLMPQWMDDPRRPDWRPFKKFLDDLAALDVQIFITELDVLDCLVTDGAERDKLVADTIHSFVSTALEQPATTMVTAWDFSDRYSWFRAEGTFRALGQWPHCNSKPACPRPTLYDQNNLPKAARDALARAFAGARQR